MLEYYKYTDKEKDELIKSMVILIDTREKKNEHLLQYFDKCGIKYKKKALKYGDYSFAIEANPELNVERDLYFDSKIVVERKGSLEEISGNLSQERDRFEKELALAPPTKVILVENGTYGDMVSGNYDTKYNNKSFWATVHSFWHKYNVPVMFMPDSRYSGFFIRGYFEYWLKNYLR